MTASKRIVLNIAATYGRSLLALVCGLFTSRWVLMALGEVDFGLYGLVGGLAAIISFINILLSGALSRYYACSLGEAQCLKLVGKENEGLEECRKWFNTALMIHTVVPLVLISVGYPIGVWAINHFLEIPACRLDACIWVFRFVCIACFVGMVNVPFSAMYTAKQYIAELTLYSVAQTVCNTLFFYYMACHSGEWLISYALWMCIASSVPQAIICLRAFAVFPECRIMLSTWGDWRRVRSLARYAFWQAFGGLGYMFRTQGIAILVNKYFGAQVNAAMSVANQVSSQTQTLVAAMSGAFQPAIATAFGAGELEKVRGMAFRTSKFASILTLAFLVPLALELPEIMRLWLKTPPQYSVGLCWLMMAVLLVDKISLGHMLACNASGKIAGYQAIGGTTLIASLPIAWIFVELGQGVYSIGIALLITSLLNTINRVVFARRIIGMETFRWLTGTVCTVILATMVPGICCTLIAKWMSPSLARILVTSILYEILFLPLIWLLALDPEERCVVSCKLKLLKDKIASR